MEDRPRFACEGLPEGSITVGEIKDEVPESVVCKYFGPRTSKSGWKYYVLTTLDEQDGILSRYQRVYDVDEMKNKEMPLQFARGLILMSRGKLVNWAQFADDRRQYREKNKKTKEANKREKAGKVREGALVPSNLGKRRCTAPGIGAFPTSLNLTIKSEGELEGLGLGEKKGSGKGFGKGGVKVSPCWLKEELDNMGFVIVKTTELIKECKGWFAKSTAEVTSTEDRLRRARILLSDREAMLSESKELLETYNTEELALRAEMEEKALLLANVEHAVSWGAVRETGDGRADD